MAEKEAKSGSGKGKLVIIAVVVLVLLAGGGGAAWWFLLRPKAAAGKHVAEAKPAQKAHFITLDPFVTNVISQDGNTHYLQVKLDLKVFDPKVDEEVTNMTPEIRNSVLRILAAQQAEKVTTVAVREQLREQILLAVNQVLNADGTGSGVAALPAAPALPASASSQAIAAAQRSQAAALARAADASASKGPVAGVYFTGFVVQ
ncbi:flagellar basal body-associated protein FliL [mine drainage metagenome]|uniref:Flagellar basal body-associated protein FliL n=1 Tax=mine drainage metagenome TaxID=410659 RepID=A0A1J5PVJ5_9ZZZZ